MKRPKKPKEDPAVGALRNRQIADLAELDEEENRRIKRALHPRQRAFRRSSGDSGRNTRSDAGAKGERAFKGSIDSKR